MSEKTLKVCSKKKIAKHFPLMDHMESEQEDHFSKIHLTSSRRLIT